MDIHRDFHGEYGNSIFFANEMPMNVRSFLTRYGVEGRHKIRIDEYSIKPKNFLFILGTLAENPGPFVDPRPILTRHAAVAYFTVQLPGENSKLGVALESTRQSIDFKSLTKTPADTPTHDII